MSKDLTTLADELNGFAQSTEEYGGQTITVYAGDVTLDSGGSLTDAKGNVYTLQHMTGDFANSGQLADIYKNGSLVPGGETYGGGFWVDIRLVNGEVLAENGKGIGWFGPDRAGAADPGPGDNSTTTTTTDDTPVVAADNTTTPTTDNTTPATTDDTTTPAADTTDDTTTDTSATTTDDTVVNLCDTTYSYQEYKMSCVTAYTTSDAAAVTGTGVDLEASIIDIYASAVADITSAGAADVSVDKTVYASVGDDNSTAYQDLAVVVSDHHYITDCLHQ